MREKWPIRHIAHTAYEAMARAYAVSEDYDSAKDYLNRAREALAKLKLDAEDQKVYSDQIRETEQIIKSP